MFKSPPEALAIGDVGQRGDGRYKVREEIETELRDGGTIQRIFEGLGLRGWFRYEKYRTTYVLPGRQSWAKGLLIEVDETPIGTFVELEGQAAAIDRAAKELGYSTRDYVLKNYYGGTPFPKPEEPHKGWKVLALRSLLLEYECLVVLRNIILFCCACSFVSTCCLSAPRSPFIVITAK